MLPLGLARAFQSVTGGASGLVLEPPIPFGRVGWYVLSISALVLGACSFAWLVRFRRLAKDYERLASTLKGMHLAAFAIIMLARLANWNESA